MNRHIVAIIKDVLRSNSVSEYKIFALVIAIDYTENHVTLEYIRRCEFLALVNFKELNGP